MEKKTGKQQLWNIFMTGLLDSACDPWPTVICDCEEQTDSPLFSLL